jgi:hypothetical protein
MREDPKSCTDFLDSIVARVNGEEMAYTADQLPKIERPALSRVSIYARTGSEDKQMILVIPYNYRRAEGDAGAPSSFDAARFIFNDGKLTICRLAEAVEPGQNKWRLSDFDPKKKALSNVRIEELDSNPYLE